MCGIGGYAVCGASSPTAGTRLAAGLRHRGPDGEWVVERGGYGLVQTRLAVIDLSRRVVYPMANETGDVHLVYNGEIYGYAAVAAELRRLGHRFATDCDAEVMLHGYEEWGVDVFARLDGMFAAAIVDERRGELLLARDALGIKPLVYTSGDRFAFASDAIALVAAGMSRGAVDDAALAEFAALHYVAPPRTGLRDVAQVEPGTVLRRRDDGMIVEERWRARPFTAGSSRTPTDAHEVARTLDASVASQLVADVPVGVFLSSGLDSSLVLDSALRAGARPVAFTIGFGGHGDYDERGGATAFARHCGVRHVVRDLDLDFETAIDAVGRAYDQPFADASSIATCALARLAHEEVTVALSGTGGDDLFAGYHRHRAHLLAPVAGRVPRAVRDALVARRPAPGSERHSARALAASYAARLVDAGATDPRRQYLDLMTAAATPRFADLLGLDAAAPRDAGRTLAADLGFAPGDDSDVLAAIQAFELATYLPGDLLTKEDRATMAVGLEGRVPLLGRDVLSLAEHADRSAKISLRRGKRALRALAAARLPPWLTRARKRGFAVPLGDLMSGSWKGPAAVHLDDASGTALDGPRAAAALRAGDLGATEAWAACALVAWERRVIEARRDAAGAR